MWTNPVALPLPPQKNSKSSEPGRVCEVDKKGNSPTTRFTMGIFQNPHS